MSKRSLKVWRAFAVAAAFVYLVAMFAPWFSFSYQDKSWLGALAETVTRANGGWGSVLGITSIVLCYLILVFALLGPRRSALSLEPLRTVLALTLVALTVLIFLERFWRVTVWRESAFTWRLVPTGGVGYGAWVALGASFALLLAFSVLDAGGLGKLLDRLPAWARLDRLETPEEEAEKAAGKQVASRAERSHRRWTGILVLALIVYVLSLLTNWWWYSSGKAIKTAPLDGFAGIGAFCALAALATLAVARLARSEREHRLERLRNRLVAFLISLTLVNVLVIWRQTYELLSPYKRPTTHSRPDYGALVTLASILLMLLATLVLNAGSWTKVRKRLPAWARLDRPEKPSGRSEETA